MTFNPDAHLAGAPACVKALHQPPYVQVEGWRGNDLEGTCDYREHDPDTHRTTHFYRAWAMDRTTKNRGLFSIMVCATEPEVVQGAAAGVWQKRRAEAWSELCREVFPS